MKVSKCWCGNEKLAKFSEEYLKCFVCGTLVVANIPEAVSSNSMEENLYSREYWFSHQENDLGYQNIIQRSRSDLSDRCIYWLKTLLKCKLPPARTLELGCAHGAFVALLQQLGFDSCGLEISPWVVEYAKHTFNIPMLCGVLEKQELQPKSFDAIIMMDVLEHLYNPIETLTHCFAALKEDGILLIQTPMYNEKKSIRLLQVTDDAFLKLLIPQEHVFLFSERSIRELFARFGVNNLIFEPAFFSIYDMFVVVSRMPVIMNSQEKIDAILSATTQALMIQALIDLFDSKMRLVNKVQKLKDILGIKFLRIFKNRILKPIWRILR